MQASDKKEVIVTIACGEGDKRFLSTEKIQKHLNLVECYGILMAIARTSGDT